MSSDTWALPSAWIGVDVSGRPDPATGLRDDERPRAWSIMSTVTAAAHEELDASVRQALTALASPRRARAAADLRRHGRQPAARHRGQADARARPGFLHDRIGRARVECVRRRRASGW